MAGWYDVSPDDEEEPLRSSHFAVGSRGAARAPGGAAGAQTYPEPKEPGKVAPKPKGPFKTYTVCKQKGAASSARSRRRSTRPRPATRSASRNGVYQRVRDVNGPQEALPAARRQPRQARQGRARRPGGKPPERRLRQRRRRGHRRRLQGPRLQGQRLLRRQRRRLQAHPPDRRRKSGVYGVYAFNSKGGEMSHSEAYYHNDAGFYIGQTPQQTKPIRSIVRDVNSWGNPIGFSAHEHALRDDHQEPLLQQRHRASSRTRWTRRSSRPPRTTSSPTTTSSGTTSTSTRARRSSSRRPATCPLVPIGTGVLLLGGQRQPRREQPDLRQLPRRRRRGRGHPARQDARGPRAVEGNQIQGNTFGRRRHRTSTAATSATTATAPTTAGARTRACR